MPANFFEQQVKSGLKNKRKLSGFLDEVAKTYFRHVKESELNYIFCTDDFLLQLNQQFLNHDTLTDIITFDLSEQEGVLRGEIYISTERVHENAPKYHTTYDDELHRVIFHGALHLCGFKDKTKKDREVMRAKEDECLLRYKKYKTAQP